MPGAKHRSYQRLQEGGDYWKSSGRGEAWSWNTLKKLKSNRHRVKNLERPIGELEVTAKGVMKELLLWKMDTS